MQSWKQKWQEKRKWQQKQVQKKSWTLEELLDRFNEIISIQDKNEDGKVPEHFFTEEDAKIMSLFEMMRTTEHRKKR